MNQAFAAKYRRKVFIAQIINELSTIFAAFCLQFNAGLLTLTVKKIMCICLFYIRLNFQSQILFSNWKVLPPLSFATEIIHPSNRSFGARLYGLPLISLPHAAVLPYLLSDNILTGRKHLIKHWVSPRDDLRPKGRGFSRWSFLIKSFSEETKKRVFPAFS